MGEGQEITSDDVGSLTEVLARPGSGVAEALTNLLEPGNLAAWQVQEFCDNDGNYITSVHWDGESTSFDLEIGDRRFQVNVQPLA
jgi:hypothetical protein